MAIRLLTLSGGRQLQKLKTVSCAGYHYLSNPNNPITGNREIVGNGVNSLPIYLDRLDVPMPAIRFKETTPDLQALRVKEQGDWKKLTMEEKKTLYRASFCQTYSEIQSPPSEWRTILAGMLVAMSAALWLFMGLKTFVYPPLPHTFTPEARQLQLQRMVALRVNPIEGLSSKYDYEKNRWKE